MIQQKSDSPSRAAYRLGVDIGGTFTDFALLDETTGALRVLKVPSRADRPSVAVVDGIAKLLESSELTSEGLGVFIHGTTLGVNTIIERTGVVAGLLVTRGFRDVLTIARQRIPDIYNFFTEVAPPLIPRRHVREIDERTLADGQVLRAPRAEEITRAVEELVAEGVQAIAVSFLHSYGNPESEQFALDVIRREFPDLYVSISSEVWPQMREYERTLAAVINAYAGPKMADYFERLQADLADLDLKMPILSTRSNGGIMSAHRAAHSPIETVLSGPASGVIGAAYLGLLAGTDRLITLDMGGTSADVGIVEGTPRLTTASFIGDYPIILPAVDVAAIGAGGGSIVWADADGVVKVGPRSAGSNPGPACYGLGGEDATVTDAYVALGIIDPGRFLGGVMKLRADLAEAALARLGEVLGVSAQEAAEAVLNVATAQMYAALVPLMARKAVDVADYSLLAYGGAGPTHAFILAQEVGITRVMIPLTPGVLCALGCLIGDVKGDFIRTVHAPLAHEGDASEPLASLESVFAELEGDARAWLAEQAIPVSAVELAREADMRYVGQSFDITVSLDGDARADDGTCLREAFHRSYADVYGYTDEAADLEVVNIRLTITGRTPKPAVPDAQGHGHSVDAQPHGQREIRWNRRAETANVYERERLEPGMRFDGPAIVVQYDTTVFVPDGFAVEIDAHRNLVGIAMPKAAREEA